MTITSQILEEDTEYIWQVRKELYLTLKDGGFGDADGIENGIIVDPLAVGSESDPSGGGSDSAIDPRFRTRKRKVSYFRHLLEKFLGIHPLLKP